MLIFAALLLTTVLGFVFYGAVAGVEALAIPWHVSKRRSR
jgi:ABC-type nitrate/sulfonate/bicarbonate transport system permease component